MKPTMGEILIAAAMLEQLLANFDPLDAEDTFHAEIAQKVASWVLTRCLLEDAEDKK